MSEIDLDELRSELSDFAEPEKKGTRSPREERVIAGFEEIKRFVQEKGRPPEHGENRDIFERLYAVRLDRIRESAECRAAGPEPERVRYSGTSSELFRLAAVSAHLASAARHHCFLRPVVAPGVPSQREYQSESDRQSHPTRQDHESCPRKLNSRCASPCRR